VQEISILLKEVYEIMSCYNNINSKNQRLVKWQSVYT